MALRQNPDMLKCTVAMWQPEQMSRSASLAQAEKTNADVPVLVQEANDPGAALLRIALLMHLAGLGDLSGVVIASDGVHPSKPRLLCLLRVCKSPPTDLPENSLSLVVRRILRKLAQPRNAVAFVFLLERERWRRRRCALLGRERWEDAVLAQGFVAAP